MRRFLIFLFILALLALAIFITIPALAAQSYGTVSSTLSLSQRFSYSARMLWYDVYITQPADVYGADQNFSVVLGESPYEIASRLEAEGIIVSARAFTVYLVYTGMDTSIMPGDYRLSPSLSTQSIAGMLQDTRASQVMFTVLAGWRMEEIAASLSTSGLPITPEAFIVAATSHEGFLFPDTYLLDRSTSADELVSILTQRFDQNLSISLKEGFARQGLTIYEAVTLASIVQREAVVAEEQPLIAGVFVNRLEASQRLESDPTVQYALGYDEAGQTWWTNPLSYADLKVDSLYNAYRYAGLPPAPICNPSLGALQAVAYPAETVYFYFRARCDGTGLHAFAETFQGHLDNACE